MLFQTGKIVPEPAKKQTRVAQIPQYNVAEPKFAASKKHLANSY